jgi:hypothetical protein
MNILTPKTGALHRDKQKQNCDFLENISVMYVNHASKQNCRGGIFREIIICLLIDPR